jgi:alkaline phosphatase
LVEDNHSAVHDSYKYSNSDRNAPHHCLADSASDSADSSGVDSSNTDCGVDAAADELGFVMDTGGSSGMDAGVVVDDDLCGGVLDVVD